MASLIACRQVAGITENPREALTSTVDGVSYGTTACASCVNTNCETESTACATDTVCTAYEACLGECKGDPKCRSQCTIDDPAGTASDVSALSACLASKCETACGLACGGIADLITETASATSCQSCIETNTNACADARRWGTSVDGDAYWRCILACPTPDCRGMCGIANPSGASLYASFRTEYAGICSGPCAYGKYWACLGRVNWPEAKSKTVMATIVVRDYASMQGVPGLTPFT